MARPRKDSVDYFPHFVNWGKTIPILEARFGNDGYAVWFKLLESLGKSRGHFIDCSDVTEWEFLLSKLRVADVSGAEMLDCLAKVGAIDAQLWRECRVIWSQNFVDNLQDLYRKRKEETPQRPDPGSFRRGNSTSAEVSGGIYPQSTAQQSTAVEANASLPGAEAPDPPATAPASDPFITLPTNTGTEYPITDQQVGEFSALYPAVDVSQQLRSMRAWLLTNHKKRKTKDGMLRFVNAWLSKEQDRPRPQIITNGNGHAPAGKRNYCPTPESDAERRRMLGLR